MRRLADASWIATLLACVAVFAVLLTSRRSPAAGNAVPNNVEFLGNREVLDRAAGRLYMYGNGWDHDPTISLEYTEVGKRFRVP